MSSKIELSGTQMRHLRETNLISQQEVAYFVGDILVVENVVDGSKRIVENHGVTTESTKRILKG